MTNPVH